jgi:hypothetical protein
VSAKLVVRQHSSLETKLSLNKHTIMVQYFRRPLLCAYGGSFSLQKLEMKTLQSCKQLDDYCVLMKDHFVSRSLR